MATPRLTKELFDSRYGKWIDKLHKEYFYPLVSLNNMQIADYIGVTRETVGKFVKLGYLNREEEFKQMFEEYKDLSFNLISENVYRSEIMLRRKYKQMYGERQYKIKCKLTDPRSTRRSKSIGRSAGYIRYLWQRLLKYLYTYKRIDTNRLTEIFGSKQIYYSLFKTLRSKGYIIECRRINSFNFE